MTVRFETDGFDYDVRRIAEGSTVVTPEGGRRIKVQVLINQQNKTKKINIMNGQDIAMWYFIIGLLYMIINTFIRKIETDGDYLLPLAWFMVWPVGILGLIIVGAINQYNKLVEKPD